jgi:hypothetical protein
MARLQKQLRRTAARAIGAGLGDALAEGIAEGVEAAFETIRQELLPLAEEVLTLLRREALEAAVEVVEDPTLGVRYCTGPGCERRAVARGLCRRHYARQVYQERKARQPREGVSAPRRRPRLTAVEGGGDLVEKKSVVPVAPIVRRKRGENTEAVPVLPVAAVPAAQNAITVESVARWLGVKN